MCFFPRFYIGFFATFSDEHLKDELNVGVLDLGKPDDIDICLEMKDWLFALEGAQEARDEWLYYNCEDIRRADRCWHATFHSLKVKAKSSSLGSNNAGKLCRSNKYPVECLTVGVLFQKLAGYFFFLRC